MSLTLTIIIPCYNEEEHIARCLDSLFENDVDRDQLEILVIDGMSSDRTREIVHRYSLDNPLVRIVDNPERIKPVALNRGIREARGAYIMRIDAHSVYEAGYVDRLLEEVRKGEVQNVGGVQIAKKSGLGFWGKAIAAALSHPLAMGNAIHRFHLTPRPRFVDTVFCGCYPKSVFERIGMFNEKLIRTQDREFNERLLRSGGKILLLPDVRAYYVPRTTIKSYASWTFQGAKWLFKARHFTEVKMARLRNYIPLAFLTYVALLISWIPFGLPPTVVLIAGVPAIVYFSALLVEGIRLAIAEKEVSLAISFPIVVVITHAAYGLGTLAGLAAFKDE